MQLRRHRKGAAAIAVAVIASALGGASGAVAAPPRHPLSTGDRDSETGTPAVWPRPQSLRTASGAESVPVTDEVVLVTGRGADRYAVDALRTVLRGAGARHITEVDDESSLPAAPALVVRIGSVAAGTAAGDGWGAADARPGRGQGLETALGALGASARKDLPSGGYRLAVGRTDGRDTVAMEGVGDDGLFHAVQTFRQLVSGHKVAGVVVRDWPGTAVRGMTEGSTGPRGPVNSGSTRSTSWGAPSRTAICTRLATTCTGRRGGARRIRPPSARTSGRLPSGRAPTT